MEDSLATAHSTMIRKMENSQSQPVDASAENSKGEMVPEGRVDGQILFQLMETIVRRRDIPDANSYTCKLLLGGDAKIGGKIIEEAAEVIDAAVRWSARKNGLIQTDAKLEDLKEGTENHIVCEAADLIYHLFVLLAHHRIDLQSVETELARRFGISGLDEKASREK